MSLIENFKPNDSDSFILGSTAESNKGMLPNTDSYQEPRPGQGGGIVDVIRNYSWYSNGGNGGATPAALNKVPPLYLVEREQRIDSLLSQALYYTQAAKGTLKNITPDIVSAAASAIAKVAAKVDPALGATANLTKSITDAMAAGISSDSDLLTKNKLESLVGIYLTKATGYKYILPYFENPPRVTNSWQEADGKNTILQGIMSEGMEVADELAKTLNITQPGIYIQKAKSYKMSDGPSITVTFPLFNTVNSGNRTYKDNYELLWLLVYQNKPFKTAFARIRPPKIYTAVVPGVANMPYADITNMSINFVGTTRNMEVSVGGSPFMAPIPEAYEVSITLTSLLADYANLMLPGTDITTTTSGNTVTIGN